MRSQDLQEAARPAAPSVPAPGLAWRCAVFGTLLAAVIVSRLPTFFVSAIGADESLYFLMAEQWRAGHLPYATLWDNKPLGIYAIFAVFQSVFGDRVASMRIASIAFVMITACAVVTIALRLPGPDPRLRRVGAIAAGLAYVVCSLSNDGLEANTEIFMVAFTALAVLAALPSDTLSGTPFIRGLITGILFGLAVMTKYVAVFEAPALAFALLAVGPPARPRGAVPICLGAVVGALPPAVAPVLLYWHHGLFDLWYQNSILANLRREQTGLRLGFLLLQRIAEWLPLWAAAVLLVASVPARWRHLFGRTGTARAGRIHLFLAIWLICGIAGVSSAKGYYSHFFIQVLPALCVTLAWVVLNVVPGIANWSRPRLALAAGLFLLLPALAAGATLLQALRPVMTVSGHGIAFHPDTAALIAQDVATEAAGAPSLYDFDYDIIIYSLTGAALPTRYAFPMFLNNCFFAYVSGVDAPAEEARILAADPAFILRSEPPAPSLPPLEQSVYAQIETAVMARYVVARRYDGAILYRRRPDAPRAASAPPPPTTCPSPP